METTTKQKPTNAMLAKSLLMGAGVTGIIYLLLPGAVWWIYVGAFVLGAAFDLAHRTGAMPRQV